MLKKVVDNAKKYYSNPTGYDAAWELDDENKEGLFNFLAKELIEQVNYIMRPGDLSNFCKEIFSLTECLKIYDT
jgi:hypothetical protein